MFKIFIYIDDFHNKILTMRQGHLLMLTVFSRFNCSMMSTSSRAVSWSCLLAKLKKIIQLKLFIYEGLLSEIKCLNISIFISKKKVFHRLSQKIWPLYNHVKSNPDFSQYSMPVINQRYLHNLLIGTLHVTYL